MRIPTVGHLAHFDEDAPYIAYVRFDDQGGNSINKAYKPIEFYKLLNENIGIINMIQPYI